MKIEVGDLVETYHLGPKLYALVQTVTGVGRVYGYWQDSIQKALNPGRVPTGWRGVPEEECIGVTCDTHGNEAPSNWTTTGTCKCSSRDLFAHGCKCGAIVRYADRVLA